MTHCCLTKILQVNESQLVATIIRAKLETLDEAHNALEQEESEKINLIGSQHISLGSPNPEIMLKEMEQQGIQDAAFREFRKKLAKFFSRFFGQQIRLRDDEKVSLLLIV